jgi:hypothetical protein
VHTQDREAPSHADQSRAHLDATPHACPPAADLSTLAHAGPDHDIVRRNMESRLRAAAFQGHDLLGSPRLLRRLSGRPEQLLPGLQALCITL